MCEYDDRRVGAEADMFSEMLSFSTGCVLSRKSIYQLKQAKIWIDTVLNNQMLFDDEYEYSDEDLG